MALLDNEFSKEEQERFVLYSGVVLSYAGLRKTNDIDFYVSLRGAADELQLRIERFLANLRSSPAMRGFFGGYILDTRPAERQAFLLRVMTHFNAHADNVNTLPYDLKCCHVGPDGLKCTTLQFDMARRILRMRPRGWADVVAYVLNGGTIPVRFPVLPKVIVSDRSDEADKVWSKDDFLDVMLFHLKTTYGIQEDKKRIMQILNQSS